MRHIYIFMRVFSAYGCWLFVYPSACLTRCFFFFMEVQLFVSCGEVSVRGGVPACFEELDPQGQSERDAKDRLTGADVLYSMFFSHECLLLYICFLLFFKLMVASRNRSLASGKETPLFLLCTIVLQLALQTKRRGRGCSLCAF